MFHKPRVFLVEFDQPGGVYYAGQTVTGRVHLITDTHIHHLTGIKVGFHGGARVHWTVQDYEGEGENRRSVEKEISSGETYFDSNLFVQGNGSPDFLNAGEYYFPFSFLLPSTIPSSFEHEFGHVRYYVKAKITAGSLFHHYHYKAFFSVASILDLNQVHNATEELHESKHKHFGCLWCRSGPLSASVHLHKRGYVPGEPVFICAEIDNKSKKLMNGTSAKIIQNITFRAQNQSKPVSRIITEKWHGPIQAGSEDCWLDERLFIPPLPPSELIYCTIISVDYVLQFRVDPSGLGFDLVIDLPLLIGTIPLSSNFNMFSNTQDNYNRFDNNGEDYSMQVASAPPPEPWHFNNQYAQLPPPCYEASVASTDNGINLRGPDESGDANWDYSPKYATWTVKQ